jgi:hypothetical protein
MKPYIKWMAASFLALVILLGACAPQSPQGPTGATPSSTAMTTPTPTSTTVSTPGVSEDVLVERIEVRTLESFPVQAQVVVYGKLPDACSLIDGVEQTREGDTFQVTLQIARRADARCAQNPTPFEHIVPLKVMGLEAGSYTVDVHGVSESFALAVDNVPLDTGLIAGRVWHDVCAVAGGEGSAPAVPSAGCVPDNGGYRANGLLEEGEPGIEGVQVTLGRGACPSDGLATIATGPDGTYVFNDLDAGTYCVTIDPLPEPNASLLLPGGWTAPALEQGNVTVTLDPGMQRMDVDFGWDHQFLPADESPAFAALLKEALAAGDYVQMQTLMADPFVIAGWRSEGQSYSPEQAIQQLQNNHLNPDTHLVYLERDAAALLGGANPFLVFGPQARIVRILFVSGWGPEGRDEALLYIAQDPDGTYRWYGVLTALGGFGQTSTLLAWHREGGIAGFCDELVIYGAGDAHATSCANDEPQELGARQLDGERLALLQTWVSEYKRFEVERTDAATADAMTIRLAFYGTGQTEAGEAEVQAILDLAAQLFTELSSVGKTDVAKSCFCSGIA